MVEGRIGGCNHKSICAQFVVVATSELLSRQLREQVDVGEGSYGGARVIQGSLRCKVAKWWIIVARRGGICFVAQILVVWQSIWLGSRLRRCRRVRAFRTRWG